MTEWLPAGLFFLILALVEGVLAVALLAALARRIERLTIVVSLATVAVWVVTRTVGLPVGPMAAAEPVGRPDLVASALELTTAVVLLARTTTASVIPNPATVYRRAALVVGAVVVLTVFGLSQGGSVDAPLDLTPASPAGAGTDANGMSEVCSESVEACAPGAWRRIGDSNP
ncbi:MAG: hypothetical protein H0V07_14050 [Propionibacteriales bacterium]|nr:hypothetical protein [Propionibacteriales bacterium]